MEASTLNKLVNRSLKGHQKSFEQIMASYGKKVYGYLVKISHDRHIADDIYQEVWIKIYTKLHMFDQNQNFEAWIITIARNTAYTTFEKNNKQLHLQVLTHEENSAINTIDDFLENIEKRRQLSEAIGQLKKSDQVLILLKYMSNYSNQQIANRLNMNPSEVKWKLYEAKKRLRKILTNEEAYKWIAN